MHTYLNPVEATPLGVIGSGQSGIIPVPTVATPVPTALFGGSRLAHFERRFGATIRFGQEFPISDMSRAVARVLVARTFPEGPLLDVGTGSGYHAVLLQASGRKVLAVDVCPRAIEWATTRAASFNIPLVHGVDAVLARRHRGTGIGFVISNLDELAMIGAMFPVISFNPPAYFYRDPVTADLSIPVVSGVYAAHVSGSFDFTTSHLYRFFKHVVLPLAPLGGHVICAWPGLERRIIVLSENGEIHHPAVLLNSWFGVTVTGTSLNPFEFFRHKARIRSSYGLGGSFMSNLSSATDCYSPLYKPGDTTTGTAPEFYFGVLHLVRTGCLTFNAVME